MKKLTLWKEIYNTITYAQDVYIIPMLCPVCLIGNTVVASVMFTKRKTSSFYYLFSLLMVDNLSLITDLFLPISVLLDVTGNQVAANIHYWNMDILGFIFRGTALNILCVLSLERLLAISNPLTYKNAFSVRHPKLLLFFSFIGSFCCHFPTALFIKVTEYKVPGTDVSFYSYGYTELYNTYTYEMGKLLIALMFLSGPIPIVFYCMVNFFTIHRLYKTRRANKACNDVTGGKVIKTAQVKLCKIFFVLSFINFFAFLPNSVTTIIAKGFPELGLSAKSYFTLFLLYGGNILRIMNSGSDFIVIICMSQEIRYKSLAICGIFRNKRNIASAQFVSFKRYQCDLLMVFLLFC